MKMIALFGIGLLALGAFLFWTRTYVGLPPVQVPNLNTLLQMSSGTQAASVAGASRAAGDTYVDLTGMILLDTNHGTPVPYIQYVTENKKVMTKQLIYAGSRGCSAYAGDLPCVSVDESQAYPQLPTGTNVRVRGVQRADRILVYQIDVRTP